MAEEGQPLQPRVVLCRSAEPRCWLLSRVGRLLEGLPHDAIPYDYAEGQYAVRVGLAGLCTARPFFDDACTAFEIKRTMCELHNEARSRRPALHVVQA